MIFEILHLHEQMNIVDDSIFCFIIIIIIIFASLNIIIIY